MAYQNLIVAVDLSEEADEVLSAARGLADAFSASLSVVTVVRPLARVYGGLDMAPLAMGEAAFENEAREQAQARVAELAAVYGVGSDDVHVKVGHPATEIKDLADANGADLIVIGTHGRHGLGLLLGSTANAVLHGVNCDVLAIKIHPVDG